MLKVKYDRSKHNAGIKNAMQGISYVSTNHQNFFLHMLFFFITMTASIVYQISYIEFLIVLLTSAIVFTAEMLNTAIEVLGDEVARGKYRDLIKVSKDCSAGAVLISVYFAIFIALIIFGPKVYSSYSLYFNI